MSELKIEIFGLPDATSASCIVREEFGGSGTPAASYNVALQSVDSPYWYIITVPAGHDLSGKVVFSLDGNRGERIVDIKDDRTHYPYGDGATEAKQDTIIGNQTTILTSITSIETITIDDLSGLQWTDRLQPSRIHVWDLEDYTEPPAPTPGDDLISGLQ